MSHHELLEYIRKAKDTGANDREITDRLYAAGWYRVDIQDALELYRTLVETPKNVSPAAPHIPHPSLPDRVVPRHYELQVVVVAVFSFVLGFIIYSVLTQ